MDHKDLKSLLDELREGSTPLPPIRTTRPELAPGWGSSVSEVREAFRNSIASQTPAQATTPHTELGFERFTSTNDITPVSASEEITTGIRHYIGHEGLVQPQEHHTPWPSSHSTLYHEPTGPTALTEDNNCCLLLTGLPSTVTIPEFINQVQIRRLGKIAAVSLKPALPFVPTAAVKVTMWDREGASRVLRAVTAESFGFEGRDLRTYWNRVKVEPQRHSKRSRVLKVRGHPDKVARSELLPWFDRKFDFVMDQVIVKQSTPDVMVVEYRFGSYVNQAYHAHNLLRNKYRRNEVYCAYLPDPCEPLQDDTSLHEPILGSDIAVSGQPGGASQQQVSALPKDTDSWEDLDHGHYFDVNRNNQSMSGK
ncbi:uncharacterized protein PG986_004188 [Apiospora aurea]|uniref:RRM domain-containing protein n=1 Tax=Apiospora aurea TaxID=335848 RepID=A0ABR1QNG2_9PEZI